MIHNRHDYFIIYFSGESQLSLEKQDKEPSEKKHTIKKCSCNESPVSSQALLERVKSQQRRIVALEAAEKVFHAYY